MPLLEVQTARQAQQFCDLPHRLHQHEPAYIGPLDNEVDDVFSPAKNQLFASGGEVQRWLLTDAPGTVIGRIAAFINPLTSRADANLPAGGLGFFECINDQAAANQLFDVACQWVQARGMLAVDGPINFGDRDRFWGVLIDGFDREPNYGMFWHPAYYQQLFEGYGFQLYFKQYTCYRTTALELHPSFQQKLARLSAPEGDYRFTHARKADPEKMAQDFLHVYNLAWGRHTGVQTMDITQARKLVKAMLPVIDERLLTFAYYGNEPVAFYLSLPELNQIFKHVGHRLNLLGKLRFVWAKWRYMRRRDKRMLGIIYGVVPEHQGKGVDQALLTSLQLPTQQAGYVDTEMNWIGDFNPRMLVLTRSIGAKIVKTHATYRKLFVNRPFERYPIIR